MKKNYQGFTLVEMLVVVGLMILVGGMAVGLFFQTLKGASKVEILKEVKQNGDYALGVMERMIRNAQSVLLNTDGQTCTSNMSKLKIENPDGNTTEFSLSGSQIALNSGKLTGSNVAAFGLTFNCNSAVTPPVVEISFTISQTGSPTRPEEKAQVSFKTTVSLRTY